jgi:hypothetical protein
MISANLHLAKKFQVNVYALQSGKVSVSIENDYFDTFTIIGDKQDLAKLLLQALTKVSEVE